MRVEIETDPTLEELKDVYQYMKHLPALKSLDEIMERSNMQAKIYLTIKKFQWAIEDKKKEVLEMAELFRKEPV